MPNMDQRLAGSRLRFIARDYIEVKWLTANNGAHNDRPLLSSAIARLFPYVQVCYR
jgi:hypothetical protein